MDKKPLSETDTRTRFITPAIVQAGWDLHTLLDKYADGGIENLEDKGVLKVPPLDAFGTPVEIVRLFGGKQGFEEAVHGLQEALYQRSAEPFYTAQWGGKRHSSPVTTP